MPDQPDLDEPFSLPDEGEDVLRKLLGVEDDDPDDSEDDDS